MTVATPTVPTLHHLVERACRAPSVHNTQPWRWQVGPRGLTLLADRARQLMRADPEGRDLVLSCGAALHHLRVAAAAEGLRALVRRMPYSDDDNVLAAIEFMPEEPDDEATAAAALIDRRRTDRRRFSSWPVPEERLDALVAAAAEQGVLAVPVTDAEKRRHLVDVVNKAARAQQFDWTAVDETAAWTGRRTGDGIPPPSLPRRSDVEQRADPVPSRFPSGALVDDLEDAEGTGYDESRFLVLCTTVDDTRSQLRAGEALSAVLLAATAQGLGTVPLSQATEVHSTRRLLRDEILGGVTCPQLIVRVGWKPVSYEPVPATPRRPLAEVVVP